MADRSKWVDVGDAAGLARAGLSRVKAGRIELAVSCVNGEFGAIHNACNHVGGPLGDGRIDGEQIVCPWHDWRFDRRSGQGGPGLERQRVPSYKVRVRQGRVEVDLGTGTRRVIPPHEPHPLAREVRRQPGGVRVVGISTTAMSRGAPRFSGSDHLLKAALAQAGREGCETQLITLNDLNFRACEGYYSKSAQACIWPCTITRKDKKDELTVVYEALVHWADVVIVATPIRWGKASSLYYRMAERLNTIQNQYTINDRLLIRDKVASFIIVGGQDNIQGVAGDMLSFFAELGFHFPPFAYIGHSRGWTAEDMENNVAEVQHSSALREEAGDLALRSVALARQLLATRDDKALDSGS